MLNSSKWATPLNIENKARINLFCFPSAGSGANSFKQWAEVIPNWVKLYGIQYPGRETRWSEKPETDAKTLAAKIVGGITPLLNNLPFAFFGHSYGALLAFEAAHILNANHRPTPARLFLSARRGPQFAAEQPRFSSLPSGQFLEKLIDFNGTPAAVLANEELMDLMIPIIRADFAADESYLDSRKTPLALDLSIYRGKSDTHVPYKQLCAWADTTTGSTTTHTFTGDHFYLNDLRSGLFDVLQEELLLCL